jgi:hypothetical protein
MTPSLPAGLLHVVIASWVMTDSWLDLPSAMGLTNAHFFVYRRHEENVPLRHARGPCGIEVTERLLLPNRGRDAAAFYDYAESQRDAALPAAVIFVHDHGPRAWHTSCAAFTGRISLYYRELAANPELDMMITLTDKPSGEGNYDDVFGGRRRLGPAVDSACAAALSKQNLSHAMGPPEMMSERDGNFYSCCATFIMPGKRLLRHPASLYGTLRDFVITLEDDQATSRTCFEYILWWLMDERPMDPQRRDFYARAKREAARLNLGNAEACAWR